MEEIEISKGNKKYFIDVSPHKGKIWIEDEVGEGGEFDQELFFDIIDKFYKENF